MTAGVQVSTGDSGGPCLFQGDPLAPNAVLGIVKGGDDQTFPSTYGFILGGGDIMMWAQLARRGIVLANANINGAGPVDTIAVVDNGGSLALEVLFDESVDYTLPTMIPTGPLTAITGGDFDGNGTGDVLAFVNNQPFYFDGSFVDFTNPLADPANALIPHLIGFIAPSAVDYAEMRSADFDGDGKDDAEGFFAGESYADVYYGSASGLTSATFMSGFPTSDGNDGKLLTLAVNPTASIGVPDYTFQLAAYHPTPVAPQEAMHIEIFDGDFGGSHDQVTANPTRTCYRLYADPLGDGSGMNAAPVIAVDDSHFVDNAWRSIGTPGQLESPLADAGSTDPAWHLYNYLLRVFVTTGSCADDPVYPTDPVENSMKVRVNGHVFFWSSNHPITGFGGAVSVIGSDLAGPSAALPNCSPPNCIAMLENIDTTYDGRWVFNIAAALSAPTTPYLTDLSEIWIAESDSDSLLDPISKGSAVGANQDIAFSVQSEPSNPTNTFFPKTYPSGQYDPNIEPCVAYDVFSSPLTAFSSEVYWVWSDLLSYNNIWIGVPTTTKPAACLVGPVSQNKASALAADGPSLAPVLRLYGEKPRIWVASTSASTTSFWTSGSGMQQIEALLPITLGEKGSGHFSKIQSPQQAFSVLKRDTGSNTDSLSKLVAALRAELLTGKLNLARGLLRGEDIARGYIYGRIDRVSDVIARADHALATACNGPKCTNDGELAAVTALVHQVNASNVTYRPPMAVTAPSSLKAAGSSSSQNDFWREF